MKGAWEQEFKNVLLHWHQVAVDTGDWQAGEQFSPEQYNQLISSFTPFQQRKVNKLLRHMVNKTQAHMFREYQKVFAMTLDKYWPQPKKPRLELVRGGKKQTI